MESFLCPWESPTYFIFSSNVPPLLHYSHFIAIAVALLIGGYVFLKNHQSVTSQLLFLLFGLFSFWAITDVFIWATNRTDIVIFWWSLQVLAEPLIYAIAFYLFYAFAHGKLPSGRTTLTIGILLLPLILLTPTHYNLEGIYLADCDAQEGPLALYYTYFLEILFSLGIVYYGIRNLFNLKNAIERAKIIYFTLGILAFLLAFTSGNIIGSVTGNWDIAQYGLFGMPVFVALLAYLIVQYRIFNVKVLATQALVLALWLLIGSLLFVVQSTLSRIVASVTLAIAIGFGFLLIKSVMREVKQREEIERLAQDLQAANEKLKELDRLKSQFLSIASHDLRSPLGVIRNFMSLLIDGTYGKLPPAAQEGAHTVFDRATDMAKSVDSYLNVSRIEQGRMKYDFTDAALTRLVSASVKTYEPVAQQKGLTVSLSVQPGAETLPMKLDTAKMNEVFNNLLDNSIKYTPKGSLVVSVEKKTTPRGAVARVVIQDTGIGMTQETIGKLFKLFSTADDSRKTNTSSTGVGLYITKAHVEAHKGRIWAESEGKDRGSRFVVELPVLG